jgi:hypothetical protein
MPSPLHSGTIKSNILSEKMCPLHSGVDTATWRHHTSPTNPAILHGACVRRQDVRLEVQVERAAGCPTVKGYLRCTTPWNSALTIGFHHMEWATPILDSYVQPNLVLFGAMHVALVLLRTRHVGTKFQHVETIPIS